MKKYRKILTGLVCCMLLTSCNSPQKENGESAAGQDVQTDLSKESPEAEDEKADDSTQDGPIIPKIFNETLNGVQFTLEPEIPEGINLNMVMKGTAMQQVPDTDAALSLWGSGKTIAETYYDETATMEDGTSYRSFYCSFTDGAVLGTDSAVMYATEETSKILNSFSQSKTDNYSSDTAFSFGTSDAVIGEVIGQLYGAGMDIGEYGYSCYALDYETLAENEEILDKDGEDITGAGSEWTEADNAYYFYIYQTWQGIPVYYGYQEFPDDSETNCPVQAIYTADGLQYLMGNRIYNFEPSGEPVKMMDFLDAAQTVAKKYGDLLTSASYCVTRAKLYQFPVKNLSGTYDIRLGWLFETRETGVDSETGGEYENILYAWVDAETGEEIF